MPVCYAVSKDAEESTSKKPPVGILCIKKFLNFLKFPCSKVSDIILHQPSQVPSKSCLFLPIQLLCFIFFSRRLIGRYTLPCTARTKYVVHQVVCMVPPLLCLGCSCAPFGLCRFSSCTTPILWRACLWAFHRNGDVILLHKTSLHTTAYSSFPRPLSKLNKTFSRTAPFWLFHLNTQEHITDKNSTYTQFTQESGIMYFYLKQQNLHS